MVWYRAAAEHEEDIKYLARWLGVDGRASRGLPIGRTCDAFTVKESYESRREHEACGGKKRRRTEDGGRLNEPDRIAPGCCHPPSTIVNLSPLFEFGLALYNAGERRR
jgi:hypothetical protein